jgi:hypothetical protein
MPVMNVLKHANNAVPPAKIAHIIIKPVAMNIEKV